MIVAVPMQSGNPSGEDNSLLVSTEDTNREKNIINFSNSTVN